MSDLVIIEAGRQDRNYWQDIWRYRELFVVLAWRDLSVRYKQTVIGIAWGVIRPLVTMIIFTFVFGRIANLPSDGAAPYPLMVLAGLLPWTLFSSGLLESSNSLINNSNLISKIYFPRIIVPVATLAVAVIDFLISLVIMIALMVWFRFWPDWRALALPAFFALSFLATLGPTLWLAALNVKYRDFRYVVPFALQVGMYISPIGFSSNVIPGSWRLIFVLNPMVGVIDGFRWCLLRGSGEPPWLSLSVGCLVTVFLVWLGITQFRRMEKSFADLV